MHREDHPEIGLEELHHRIYDVRDHLFKGETLVLASEGRPLALLKPLEEEDRIPDKALVRNISYIRLHKRMLSIKIRQGRRIVLTFRGRKIGVVEPGPFGEPA